MTDKCNCEKDSNGTLICPVHSKAKKELLTEEEELGNMVLLDVWYEYKIIDTAYTKTQGNTEIELNDHAQEGWRVVGVTDHWIYLEKRRTRYLKG